MKTRTPDLWLWLLVAATLGATIGMWLPHTFI
jgi:hypothetical protein